MLSALQSTETLGLAGIRFEQQDHQPAACWPEFFVGEYKREAAWPEPFSETCRDIGFQLWSAPIQFFAEILATT